MGGALVGRIPEGMIGLSLVLLVRSVTASFASAGTVVAAFGIGSAVGGILQGRRIDRTRQTPVLVGCGLVHPAALVLVVVATQHRALALMVALAAVAGVSAPAFTPCMRALWSSLLQDDRQRHAAFALEAVVVEATFLIGPALVAGLLTAVSPATALLAAAGMSGTGALAFAASGASRRWRGQGAPPSLAGPLASAGVRTLLVAAFLFGAGDGLLQIAAPAFAVDRGAPALAGLLLAGMSVGSLVGGAVYGARAWPGRAPVRFALLQGLLAAVRLAHHRGGPRRRRRDRGGRDADRAGRLRADPARRRRGRRPRRPGHLDPPPPSGAGWRRVAGPVVRRCGRGAEPSPGHRAVHPGTVCHMIRYWT